MKEQETPAEAKARRRAIALQNLAKAHIRRKQVKEKYKERQPTRLRIKKARETLESLGWDPVEQGVFLFEATEDDHVKARIWAEMMKYVQAPAATTIKHEGLEGPKTLVIQWHGDPKPAKPVQTHTVEAVEAAYEVVNQDGRATESDEDD